MVVVDRSVVADYKADMAFDDLARHMASRDKRKLGKVGSAAELVAEAAMDDRRMAQKRDLILGALLLAGGLFVCVLIYLTLKDAYNPNPGPLRPPNTEGTRYPIGLSVIAVFMVIGGFLQMFRGIRGRSA